MDAMPIHPHACTWHGLAYSPTCEECDLRRPHPDDAPAVLPTLTPAQWAALHPLAHEVRTRFRQLHQVDDDDFADWLGNVERMREATHDGQVFALLQDYVRQRDDRRAFDRWEHRAFFPSSCGHASCPTCGSVPVPDGQASAATPTA